LVEECYQVVNDKAKLIRILSLAKSAIRHNMAGEVPKITVPVLLIWGKQDTITPPHVAEEFHSLFPNSELHWIDECGHVPRMEQPEAFNAILEAWLQQMAQPGCAGHGRLQTPARPSPRQRPGTGALAGARPARL